MTPIQAARLYLMMCSGKRVGTLPDGEDSYEETALSGALEVLGWPHLSLAYGYYKNDGSRVNEWCARGAKEAARALREMAYAMDNLPDPNVK